jgi:hypothetical protein
MTIAILGPAISSVTAAAVVVGSGWGWEGAVVGGSSDDWGAAGVAAFVLVGF